MNTQDLERPDHTYGVKMQDTKVIEMFEEAVTEYAGAKYGVAVSSCTNAIFLSLQYLKYIGEVKDGDTITIPARTFLSVPCQIKLCGLNIEFVDKYWTGLYQLEPTRVWDCSTRFRENMYVGRGALQCLSFQYRKQLKIGRGGMILTNNKKAARWLKMARINGRHEGVSQADEKLEFCGWNMYLTPEQAARGLTLLGCIPKRNPDCGSSDTYPCISNQEVFK